MPNIKSLPTMAQNITSLFCDRGPKDIIDY